VPCRARTIVQGQMRRRASRPQLKRDPLGRSLHFLEVRVLGRCICIGALVIGLGCRVGSGPEALPDGPADFRGTITRVWEDGATSSTMGRPPPAGSRWST
jgi:hypothetical protein